MVKVGAVKQKKLAEMVAARGLSPSPLFYDRFSSGISLFYYRFSSGIHCFMIGSHSILVQPSHGQRSYGHVPYHRVPFGHIMCTHAPRDHASWGDMHDKQAPGYNASVDRWWVQRTVTAYPYASRYGTTSCGLSWISSLFVIVMILIQSCMIECWWLPFGFFFFMSHAYVFLVGPCIEDSCCMRLRHVWRTIVFDLVLCVVWYKIDADIMIHVHWIPF